MSMLDDAHDFLERAAKRLDLPDDVLQDVMQANAEHKFVIKTSDGKAYDAYRVQHSNLRGPYKGGIRFHPKVNLDEVRTLATLMSLKTAAVGLPLGGGKGGVAVDPRELSKAQLEEISRKYAASLHEHIGPDKDIPAPDVNTDSTIIDWMVDEFEKLTGDTSHASFTGKSIAKGGSLGRDAATGRGGVFALEELLKLEDFKQSELTLAVQGYGNVGSFFATVGKQRNPHWKLVAASDSEAAVYLRAGLDPVALQQFKVERGRFKDYKATDAQILSNDELLSLDVDILVLAGFEDTVNKQNVDGVRARYIVELANSPVTGEAFAVLTKQGKTILPDIIANAGGVVVSYLEWVQNKAQESWTESKVNDQLADYITKATARTYHYAKDENINLKDAAFTLALKALTETK